MNKSKWNSVLFCNFFVSPKNFQNEKLKYKKLNVSISFSFWDLGDNRISIQGGFSPSWVLGVWGK